MEKRKTIGGEDILYAMSTLGFENYGEVLKIHLAKLRAVCIHTWLLVVVERTWNADFHLLAHRVERRRLRMPRLNIKQSKGWERSKAECYRSRTYMTS
jgi:hypothetical protein